MSDKSAIEWTDATWNPVRARNIKTGKVGWYCEHSTTGCEFCYAEGFNKRLGTGLAFKPGHRKDVELFLDEKMLTLPLRWKKPRMIFVCSMSDLFADFVPDEWIDRVFAIMALSPQHRFQVLTKRAVRMRDYFAKRGRLNSINGQKWSLLGTPLGSKINHGGQWMTPALPLHNVWLGVSTERQQEADERIPLLLQTPAAVRFISAEPLLGPVDLAKAFAIAPADIPMLTPEAKLCSDPTCGRETKHYPREFGCRWGLEGEGPPQLDWVIVGGESGPGYRAMLTVWAWEMLLACSRAGVPFFMKQMAGKKPIPVELFVREMPGHHA